MFELLDKSYLISDKFKSKAVVKISRKKKNNLILDYPEYFIKT